MLIGRSTPGKAPQLAAGAHLPGWRLPLLHRCRTPGCRRCREVHVRRTKRCFSSSLHGGRQPSAAGTRPAGGAAHPKHSRTADRRTGCLHERACAKCGALHRMRARLCSLRCSPTHALQAAATCSENYAPDCCRQGRAPSPPPPLRRRARGHRPPHLASLGVPPPLPYVCVRAEGQGRLTQSSISRGCLNPSTSGCGACRRCRLPAPTPPERRRTMAPGKRRPSAGWQRAHHAGGPRTFLPQLNGRYLYLIMCLIWRFMVTPNSSSQ